MNQTAGFDYTTVLNFQQNQLTGTLPAGLSKILKASAATVKIFDNLVSGVHADAALSPFSG